MVDHLRSIHPTIHTTSATPNIPNIPDNPNISAIATDEPGPKKSQQRHSSPRIVVRVRYSSDVRAGPRHAGLDPASRTF